MDKTLGVCSYMENKKKKKNSAIEYCLEAEFLQLPHQSYSSRTQQCGLLCLDHSNLPALIFSVIVMFNIKEQLGNNLISKWQREALLWAICQSEFSWDWLQLAHDPHG